VPEPSVLTTLLLAMAGTSLRRLRRASAYPA
jgi:hypothetical protein